MRIFYTHMTQTLTQRQYRYDIEHSTCKNRLTLQITNKYIKRCATSLAFRDMPIKTTMRYHYAHIKTAKIKTMTTPNARKNAEKLDFIYCGWEFQME